MSDIEDKLMAKRETEEKKRQLKVHEDRLKEINDSLRKKNLRLMGFPRALKGTEVQNTDLNKSTNHS